MEVRSVETIIGILNRAKVEYLVVGGLAVNAHGFVRFTKDVDLVISLEPQNIIRALHALNAGGFRPRIPVTPEEFAHVETRNRWISEKNMVVLQLWSDGHRGTPIDIFIHEPFPFSEEYMRAPQFEIAPDVWAPFVTLNRLLEMKRTAGRPQDLEDIRRLQSL